MIRDYWRIPPSTLLLHPVPPRCCLPNFMLSPRKWQSDWSVNASNDSSSVPEYAFLQDAHMAARVLTVQQILHTNPDAKAFSSGRQSRHWCFWRPCSQILLINEDEKYVRRSSALLALVLLAAVGAFLWLVGFLFVKSVITFYKRYRVSRYAKVIPR